MLHERVRLSGSDEDAALAEAIDHAVDSGALDLHGHLDPATVTIDEIQTILDSVGEGHDGH